MIAYRFLMWVGIISVLACGIATSQQLDADDVEAMRRAAKSYAGAWLTNDADTVMATFVDEPVLSPSGLPYIEGQAAARNFWFPSDAPPTTVTEFVMSEIEYAASGDIGYVRGTFRLAFEYDENHYENQGKYLTLLRKGPEGSWLITHHLWDDLPQAE